MPQDTITPTAPSDSPAQAPLVSLPSLFRPSPLDHQLRLSSYFTDRFLLGSAFAFIGGGILGGYHGSTMASLRFRAENSHRFPTTTTGWYQYHKSKNYNCMLRAVKEGLRLGPRLAGWTGGFFLLEELVDRWRLKRDAISSVVAALTLSSLFSLRHRFNFATHLRTARVGLVAGLAYGVAQDILSLARGRRVGYVDTVFGKPGK
ncbi:MAG: hypothetical protein LQ345_001959 [Seirophora villosa]|nr:MAG: hypothetical protein LQ345_001959 [Seirophora villosa]